LQTALVYARLDAHDVSVLFTRKLPPQSRRVGITCCLMFTEGSG